MITRQQSSSFGQPIGWRCFTFHFLIPLLKVLQFNKVHLSHSLITTSVVDTNQGNKGQGITTTLLGDHNVKHPVNIQTNVKLNYHDERKLRWRIRPRNNGITTRSHVSSLDGSSQAPEDNRS